MFLLLFDKNSGQEAYGMEVLLVRPVYGQSGLISDSCGKKRCAGVLKFVEMSRFATLAMVGE